MIKCRNITKIYNNAGNETVALKDVSFDINEGEFVAIMGPSGSGKSTLMNVLGALDSPTSGKYYLAGDDVSKLSDDKLAEIRNKRIGFVFQSFNLLPRTSVMRNVMLPLICKEVTPKEREVKAKEVLEKVNIMKQRWGHLSNQLSGGQIQRVAIARALINNPAIILADEPTGNLDTKTGEKVLSVFRELNKKHGHTIVMITHEDEVAEHADRIIVIRDGEIVEDKKVKA